MSTSYQQRQQKLLKFFQNHRRLPSYSEMLGLFKLSSKNAIFRVVNKFIDQGLLDKDSTGKLVPQGILTGVKILGNIEAGWPSPAEEELVDTITLDDYLVRNKQASFLLRVTGESMVEAGIMPGDLVIVERGGEPNSGAVVVAEVDGEWTIKYYDKRNGTVRLVPANKKFKTIRPKESLRVAGVVVSVIRKYL
jgi:SOS regulatory protein LexA